MSSWTVSPTGQPGSADNQWGLNYHHFAVFFVRSRFESSLTVPAFDWVCLWPPQPGHCLHLLDKTQSPSPPWCQNNQQYVGAFTIINLIKLVHPRHRLTGHSLKELTAMRCSCSVISISIAWTQSSCSTSAPQCCPQCLRGPDVHPPSCKMQLQTVPN